LLYGNDDPLFPRTKIGNDKNLCFTSQGLEPINWSTASPIRKIFKEAFENAGLKYYSPHTFRNTIVQLGQRVCKNPEQFKAWSQNLGHSSLLVTFTSYGNILEYQQGDIIKSLWDK